jgi:ATP-dependent exoDNAse (exonuclease V) beta subunit
VADRKEERELSQSRRLLYVAVTRARDLVVLSGRGAKQVESWRQWIDEVAAVAVQRGLLRVSRDGGSAMDVAAQRAPVDPERFAELEPAEHPDVQRLVYQVYNSSPDGPQAGASAPKAQPEQTAGSVSAPVTQIADAAACARRYQLLHELRLEERPDAEPALPDPLGPEPFGSAAALGTLAHRLLELLPLKLEGAERRAELERLLALEGEDPSQHGEVLDAACAFLDSPLGRRMADARPSLLYREQPFTLRLSGPGAPELLLRGQIDALLLERDAATVVDYKLSQARDPARYAAQLDAYALAAAELVQGALPVRTGIVFLRSKGAPYAERPPASPEELAAIRTRLLGAARAIAAGRRTGEWPKVEIARCKDLECGFVRRCHGNE